jgi:hypothetical protein
VSVAYAIVSLATGWGRREDEGYDLIMGNCYENEEEELEDATASMTIYNSTL